MAEVDDLSQLMPNTQLAALRASPGANTEALRDYIRVLGNKQNVAAAAQPVQAVKSRREALQLRAGTGRAPQRHRFSIRIRAEDLEAHEARLQEEAAAIDPDELRDALLMQALAQRRAALQARLRPGTGRVPPRRQFRLHLGDLLPPSPEPEAALTATPGSALLPHASTQMGLARTPGTSGLLGRYTPMEGVPERLAPAARGAQPPGTALRSGGAAARRSTPQGYTPVEGVPERLMLHRASGGTRVLSNTQVDSPVEGLVRQAAAAASPGGTVRPGPAPAGEEFAFAAAVQSADGEGGAAGGFDDDGDDHGGDYYDDDGGGYDQEYPESGGMADAAMQTGTSLEQAGADGHGSGGAPDDGAGGSWMQEDGGADHWAAPAPEQQRKPRVHRPTRDPGVRLRNELKRKSLAINPRIGRQEVAPGIRRTMRESGPPLMYWLNETKEFTRKDHKTMPTIHRLIHKTPNTPWRMQSDPFPARKRRAVAAKPKTPAAGAAEEEDAETETDEEDEAATQRQLATVMAEAGEEAEEAEAAAEEEAPSSSPRQEGAEEEGEGAAEEEGGGWADHSDGEEEQQPESSAAAAARGADKKKRPAQGKRKSRR